MWLPLQKVLKMWLLCLVIIFSGLVEVVKPQNLFHVYNEVFRNFQKSMIMICAKYFVTSCLFTVLSEAEENFNMSSR